MTAYLRKQAIITYSAAAQLVGAAIAHAEANGWSIAVAVVEPSGALLASGRMDGVAPTILEFALDKAFTASLGKSSLAFNHRMASSKDLELGLVNRPRVCAWEGGLPILVENTLIGAIGVSGAAGPEDAACAAAALQTVGLSPDAT